MSPHGLHLEGLARFLMADLMNLIGILVFIGIMVIVAGWIIRHFRMDGMSTEDTTRAKKWVARVALIMVVVSCVGFVFHVFGVVLSNRLPRNDVDKSGVYEQMESHKK